MICSCSISGVAVPALDQHADDAHHLIGAAGVQAGSSAFGSTQTISSIRLASRASRLAVPSLKPSRLRTVSWPSFLIVCGRQEAVHLPAQRQQVGRVLEDVAQRVDVGLGRVRAELQQQVAVAECAPRARRWGTAPSAMSCVGLSFCRPKRSSNSEAPSATVMVRLSGKTAGPSRPVGRRELRVHGRRRAALIRKAMRSVRVRTAARARRDRRPARRRPRPAPPRAAA